MANQTALVVFAAVLAVVCGILVVPRVIMLTGYTSKIACSAVFVHGRSVDSVMAGELHTFPLSLASITVHSNSSVTSTFGVIGRTSQFVEGFGCVLVHYNGPDRVAARLAPSPPQPSSTVPGPWPFGSDDGTTGDISSELKQHLDGAFSEPDPTCLRTTRAVVVAHKGKLVYEGYADGFNAKMRYAGWSMTKSVMSAIVGLRVAEGAMRLQDEVSPTSASLESLLHMTSGLRFAEEYSGVKASDVVTMLFQQQDVAAYAASQPQIHAPDEVFSYSSGTTNIISRALRSSFSSDAAYWAYPYERLFSKVNMDSMILEVDQSGTFVGSSFSHATARDWARFGQLFLNKGEWNGEQVLPEAWVDFSLQPVPSSHVSPNPKKPHAVYGAQWWLNKEFKLTANATTTTRRFPSVSDDVFFAHGFEQQGVFVVPRQDLVVVRLGVTSERKCWDEDAFLAGIVQHIQASPSS